MKRIKAEILHYKRGLTHDKVYIAEIIENQGTYYVYANYGKRLQENLINHLKLTTDYKHAAEEAFDKLIREKVKKGYRYVPNGTHMHIPGFKDVVTAHNNLVASKVKKDESEPGEHRRLVI